MEKITCPQCDYKFDIEGAFAKELETQFRLKLKDEKQKLFHQFADKEKQLMQRELDFEEKRKQQNLLFNERLEKAKSEQYSIIQNQIKRDYEGRLSNQSKEIEEKLKEIEKLREAEIDLMKTKRQLKHLEGELELKMQKKLIEEQKQMEYQISKRVREEMQLKLEEKNKQLQDQKKLIEEMKRKSEQGSMQMQGEVQELAIENILKLQFPYDLIEEVPKGIRGADTIQIVRNQNMQNCGKIVYESKRTKAFSNEWIEKIKNDQRAVMADLAVIVTETLPKELDRFGQIKGVWICDFHEFKSLTFILREMLIKTMEVRDVQQNKGDKMEQLYDYLTSEQFSINVNGIMDAFQTLKEDIEKEKRAMFSIWKRREKQLERVLLNTSDMYGSIRGIGGREIPEIKQLELPEFDNNQIDQ